MSNNATRNTIMLALASTVIAFVLFYFLDSYAAIENSAVSFGGALAGFWIVFKVLSDHYGRVEESELQQTIDELTVRLAEKRIKVNLIFDPDPPNAVNLVEAKCQYSVKYDGSEDIGELEISYYEGGWQCKLPPECEEKRVQLTLIDTNNNRWVVPRQWPVMNMVALQR